ncbi:MAG: flagellar motor switch protein FliN [Pirellulaceae bacterium]
MSGDEQIGQDEIEELLRQAQSSKPEPAPPPQAKAEVDAASLGQDEIEALLNSSGGKPAAASPPPAAAPRPAAASSPAPAAKPPQPAPVAVTARSDVGDDMELLLTQAEQAIASVDDPVQIELEGIAPFQLKDFGGTPASSDKATLELLREVELGLKIELGRTHMYLEDVLKLRKGSVVPLDKLAGDPVDIYVNGRLIAQGEVLVLNDNFCVRVAELISGDDSN